MALYTGCATTPRITGNGLLTQRLFAIENKLGSKRLVRVRRLSSQMDATALLTAVKPLLKTTRGVGEVTNGAQVAKGTFDTLQTSDHNVRLWHHGAPDLALGTEVIGTPGTIHWGQFSMRLHSLAEQVIGADENQLSVIVENKPFSLYPGQYILVEAIGSAVTSNPTTNHWFFNCAWTEEVFTTFTISGVVRLGGVPVVGAEVIVVIADDLLMTNAVLWDSVTTSAGGAWSSNIPVGKLAFAYAQNEVSGTKYTSLGRPYQQ